MKLTLLLVAALLPLAAYAKPPPIVAASLDPTDLADLEQIPEDVARIKRSGLGSGSGSFDLLSGLKKTILSGIGSASASLVAGSSSSSLSSGSGHGSGGSSYGASSSSSSSSGHSYEKPHEDNHFDGWSLKKSILNTLFQAVKAITGGVTAIKGQLIKGSGYLVSGAGKLIASGGDAVTGVGKKIALSAHLIPPKHASHPFAKLSGLLSSSSSGLSGSSSSSSSPSNHHESSGESFTSYEGPTSYGHDSTHGTVSGPSGPSYIPPSKGSSHKAPSLNSYGAELDHGSYSSSGKYGHLSDAPGLYAPEYHGKGHGSVVEASDVLRQILNQKIPQHPSHPGRKVIAQYEIPSDANPPPFKPMKNGHGYLPPTLYGVPVGPIDSVTHSHSITTSFGAAEPSLPNSYDIYRSMALKHHGGGPVRSKPSHGEDSLPSPRGVGGARVSYELLPPPKQLSASASSSAEIVHDQQLHELTRHLGNGIEVQKSLTYEIADPATVRLHKRRTNDEQTPTTTTTTTSTTTSTTTGDRRHRDLSAAQASPANTKTFRLQ